MWGARGDRLFRLPSGPALGYIRERGKREGKIEKREWRKGKIRGKIEDK